MYLKKSSISKAMIILLVLMHMCYFLIAFGWTSLFADSFVSKPRTMLFLIMIVLSLLCTTLYRSKYLWFELVLIGFVWIRGWVGAAYSGYDITEILSMLRPYLYPILAVPIYALLEEEEWSLESILKFLVVVITIDTCVRVIDSLAENLTGSFLWTNIILGESGYRNDIYRISPSCFDVLAIPMAFYLFCKDKNKKTWIICIIINVIYAAFFWQARSATAYKIVILILLFYMQRVSGNKKGYRVIIGLIALCIAINTSAIGNFLDTLSVTNSEYGGSTTYRLNAILYFTGLWSGNIFLGTGLLDSTERYAVGGGTLGDIGFLYSTVQFGVLMIAFYLAIFLRGLYVYFKIRHEHPDESLLIFSMTLLFLLFGINLDSFYMFALALPFYMAITEHLYDKSNNEYYLNPEAYENDE